VRILPHKREPKRVSAFGDINIPKSQLLSNIAKCANLSRLAFGSVSEPLSASEKQIKRVKSHYSKALCLEVIYQPVLVKCEPYGEKGFTMKSNDIWKVAPNKTCYYKSQRLSSLLNEVAVFGHRANIAHDLGRLATKVWSMTKRSFDGLCRRIRSKIRKPENPETAVDLGVLTDNPPPVHSGGRVKRRTQRPVLLKDVTPKRGCSNNYLVASWLKWRLYRRSAQKAH
jgi:hypothetical protein